MKLEKLLTFIFGQKQSTRFFRLTFYLSALLIFLILYSNISYSKKDGLQWTPALKINIEVKK